MALQHFLCGLTVVIILIQGCHSQQKCGLAPRNTRIFGGEDASPGSWPWQVSLNHSKYGFFCGGSLITDQWVMTAAHCIFSHHNNITVHLGQHSRSGPNSNEETRGVEQATCHPSSSSMFNDICLLKLSAPVNLTDYIFPVCLASENSTFHTGVNTWVTGFGKNENYTIPNILQEVNVPVVGNNECRCSYGSYVKENMICSGLGAGGKGPCFGDEGGALVVKKDSSWFQAGILIYGLSCLGPNYPAIYTRVSQYQDWISNVTGSSQPGFVTFISPGVDSDTDFTCPTTPPPTTPPPVTCRDDGSVFDGGENMIHFSLSTHFISLCILVLSLFVLLGDP